MIEWAIKPLLLVVFAGAASLCTKRAAIRHFLWTLAFVGLFLIRITPPQAIVQTPLPGLVTAFEPIDPPATAVVFEAPLRPGAPPSPRERIRMVIQLFWYAGIFVVWARVGQGILQARRIISESQNVGRCGRADLYRASTASIPFTWGVVRPAIVLPASADGWTAARRQHVLAHEQAHIQRADWLTQTFAQLLCGVYWFHPLVWFAAARMRRESERACDDAVIREGGHVPHEYAEDLLGLSTAQQQQQIETPMAVVAMWNRSQLEDRIMRILNNPDGRGLGRLAALAIGFTAILAIAPLASVRLLAQNMITLQGVVNDSSGARVPGATINISTAGESPRSVAGTVSGIDGSFRIQFQAPEGSVGMVFLRVEKAGFAASMLPLTGLGAGPREIIRDVTLQVGQIRENLAIEGVRPSNLPQRPAGTKPQRVRVGGNVQAANLISKTNPEYPKELQDKGIEGIVELEAVISKEGNVLSLHPRSKTVDEGLVQAAIKAVQTWQYRPTLLNGEPIEVVTTVTVRFYLK